ncbi:MAG: M20/M25/M40 family metallo-hydrolase [archaeon]
MVRNSKDYAEAAELLSKLVKIPSVEWFRRGGELVCDLGGSDKVLDFLEKEYKRFLSGLGSRKGIYVRFIRKPEYLLVLLENEKRRRPYYLWLGHVDTVTVEDYRLKKADPFSGKISHGNVYGRGACDMKGGVASIFLAHRRAITAVLSGEASLNGTIGAVYTKNEETNVAGVRALVGLSPDHSVTHRPDFLPDYVHITEPTRLCVGVSGIGYMIFNVEVKSKNAVGDLLKVLPAVYSLEKIRPGIPLYSESLTAAHDPMAPQMAVYGKVKEVEVEGESAHSYSGVGKSAIRELVRQTNGRGLFSHGGVPFVLGVETLPRDWPYPTMKCFLLKLKTAVEAEKGESLTPANKGIALCSWGTVPDYPLKDMEKHISREVTKRFKSQFGSADATTSTEPDPVYGLKQKVLTLTSKDGGIECKVRFSFKTRGYLQDTKSDFISKALEATKNELGSAKTISMGPCEAFWLKLASEKHKVPIEVVVQGPGDLDYAHTSQEFCPIEQVLQCADILTKTARRLGIV